MVTYLLIYGSSIPFVQMFDFLGFVLYTKLSAAAHINKIAKQRFHLINVLKSIRGISMALAFSGLSFTTLCHSIRRLPS